MEIFYAIISKSGSVTIPAKIRKEMGLVGGSIVSFSIEGNSVVLRKVK